MSGRPVLERNCVLHIACVSCSSVVAPQCDCSIASMIAHGTHPSRHLACESREPQLVNKGETPVCCNVDWGGSRINRNSRRSRSRGGLISPLHTIFGNWAQAADVHMDVYGVPFYHPSPTLPLSTR